MSECPTIYGMHEPGLKLGESRWWIVFTHRLGHRLEHVGNLDYRPWSGQGYGIIARLNHGYAPDGTVPEEEHEEGFTRCVERWVKDSSGCYTWIIGNEPNHSQERPHGEPITPERYARVYASCYWAIRLIPGHEHDIILPAPVAPWNVETGDWLEYQLAMLTRINTFHSIMPGGLCLHTYTHGPEPELITSAATMGPPYENRYYHFRHYRQMLDWTPNNMRALPVYITETNQNDPWVDDNSGWVYEAYREINAWNQTHSQQVRCLALYRWPKYDQWFIEGKDGVVRDFQDALKQGYTWKDKDDGETPVTEERVREIFRDEMVKYLKAALAAAEEGDDG